MSFSSLSFDPYLTEMDKYTQARTSLTIVCKNASMVRLIAMLHVCHVRHELQRKEREREKGVHVSGPSHPMNTNMPISLTPSVFPHSANITGTTPILRGQTPVFNPLSSATATGVLPAPMAPVVASSWPHPHPPQPLAGNGLLQQQQSSGKKE